MMEIIYSIIYGIVQGLTEFLPISSTGHLVILHDIWPLEIGSDLGFDVVLHGGTLVALVIFFGKDILRYLRGFFSSFAKWDLRNNVDQRLAWFLFVGTIPAALIGYLIEDKIEDSLRSLWVIIIALVIGAFFFFLIEKIAKRANDINSIKLNSAITIGFAQAIALIPGVSRSGITIITGLACGLKREAAARFAFLLSLPIIFGAGTKKMLDLIDQGVLISDWVVYLTGFLASLISGYLCIKYFLRYLRNRSLNAFAVYRIILAIALVILITTGVLS